MILRVTRLATAACLLCLLALPLASGSAEDDRLVRIDRAALEALDRSDLWRMQSVLELKDAWVVRAPRVLAERLVRQGAAIILMEDDPSGKWFEVVRQRPVDGARKSLGEGARERSRPAAPSDAAASGIEVEPGVWLLPADPRDEWTRTPGSHASSVPGDGTARLSRVFRPGVERERLARALPTPEDARIAVLAAQVSADRVMTNIAALQAFGTRDATTASSRSAANFLRDYFRSLGLEAEHEDFEFTGTIDGGRTPGLPASNVVATMPGTVSPGEIVILGAHYDSWSRQSPRAFAPGADDNASGTAAVMEIARVLAGQQFDFTIRFIAFGAEEYGLHGSRFHAQAAASRDERIVAAMNLDMVGYVDRPPEDLDIVINEASQWLADRYEEASGRYAPLPIDRDLEPTQRSSDHAPFWDNGFAAMLGIEDNGLTNPHWHQPTDTIDTIDAGFATSVARATLATAASLAQLSRQPPPPRELRVQSSVLRSLFARVKVSVLEWAPPPGGARGYHVYRSAAPHFGYERLTQSPVTGTAFTDSVRESADRPHYYVVTAVDAAGRESNYSAESGDSDARSR